MKKLRIIVVLSLLTSVPFTAFSEALSREQIKGLDEQVQDIKKDVLAISAELSLLEEKLLFPSNTQVSLFISVAKNTQFTPDAVQIKINEKSVAHHIYSFKEIGALQRGGVQRIYTGNLKSGEHKLELSIIGRQNGGESQVEKGTFSFNKKVGAKLVEIHIGSTQASLIEIKER